MKLCVLGTLGQNDEEIVNINYNFNHEFTSHFL